VWLVESERDVATAAAAQRLERVGCVLFREGELGLEALEAGLHDGADQDPPVREVPVHRGRGNARFGRDRADRQTLGVALRGQHPYPRLDQFVTQPATFGLRRAALRRA
jgi:hypothetical protein